MEGAREGRPESGLDLPLPEGGAEGRPWTGWWPPAPETGHFGLLGCGALHARRCLCSRGCVSCRGSACATAPPGGGSSFVFHGGTTPLSPKNDPLLCSLLEMPPFPTPDPMESFAEQVSGVKLLAWGMGRESVVETGTEIFARGCIWELGPLEPEC